jgi:transcription termination/antitermination protein NusA
VNLTDVIEDLVEERGLEKDKVISAVCDGVLAAYSRKYPDTDFSVVFDNKTGEAQVFVKKKVVSRVAEEDSEISLKKSHSTVPGAKVDDVIDVLFGGGIGRVEVLVAKQVIANKIRTIEQAAVFAEFEDKEGTIVTGNVHKKERAGYVVQLGEAMALLPSANCISGENIRIGGPVRALLVQVLSEPKGDYQLILDRASAEFVKKLIELEIPEVFEGIVEIKKIVRSSGYKTKVAVVSASKDIDPVGTCIGVDGVRIKPILRELGGEKIDVIGWSESLESFVKNSLKPAEIDKVETVDDKRAMVWLAKDQRSRAIGKMGRNILLASKLTGIEINLQEVTSGHGVEAPELESLEEEEEKE